MYEIKKISWRPAAAALHSAQFILSKHEGNLISVNRDVMHLSKHKFNGFVAMKDNSHRFKMYAKHYRCGEHFRLNQVYL